MESGAVVQDAVWVAILEDAHAVVVGQALTIGQVAGGAAHLRVGAEPAEGAATKATKVAETAAHLEVAAESSSTGGGSGKTAAHLCCRRLYAQSPVTHCLGQNPIQNDTWSRLGFKLLILSGIFRRFQIRDPDQSGPNTF